MIWNPFRRHPPSSAAAATPPASAETTPGDWLDCLLRDEIYPALKEKGFVRKGTTFRRWMGQNCQVINFQASQFNDRQSGAKFRINLGVWNKALYDFEPLGNPKAPTEYQCQWRAMLDAAKQDFWAQWWTLRATPNSAMGQEIRAGLTNVAIPLLDSVISDVGMRDWFRRCVSDGRNDGMLGRHIRLLAILVATIGPHGELPDLLDLIRTGKAWGNDPAMNAEYAARVEALASMKRSEP